MITVFTSQAKKLENDFPGKEKKWKRYRVLKDSTKSEVEFSQLCILGGVNHGIESGGMLLVK